MQRAGAKDRVPHIVGDDYTPSSACNIWVKDPGWCLASARICTCRCHGRGLRGGDDGRRQGFGPVDDAGFVKLYESFTGKLIAPPAVTSVTETDTRPATRKQ
jgi:hypothetical protein